MLDVSIEGAQPIIDRLEEWDERFVQYARANLQTLGDTVTWVMRHHMEPKRYTGHMANSITNQVTGAREPLLKTGPEATYAANVRMGRQPGTWVPIAPLIQWARWKLGPSMEGTRYIMGGAGTRDESVGAAYAVRRKIFDEGIAPYDFLEMTMQDGRFQAALRNTAQRLGLDLAAYVAGDIGGTVEGVA